MVQPVAGEIVVLPFPQTDLQAGKRRPALVVSAAGGSDLILCQITSRKRGDAFSVPIADSDFRQGKLSVESYARVNRLFTVEASVIIYTAAALKDAKLQEIKARLRELFA